MHPQRHPPVITSIAYNLSGLETVNAAAQADQADAAANRQYNAAAILAYRPQIPHTARHVVGHGALNDQRCRVYRGCSPEVNILLHQQVGTTTYKTARRIVIAVVGGTVLLLGIAMIVLPGPATVMIPAGLAILALEFAWARRWLRRIKAKARQTIRTLNRANNVRPDTGQSATDKTGLHE